jgi:hypothetical protein
VKQWQEKRGLSQVALGDLAGLENSFIGHI